MYGDGIVSGIAQIGQSLIDARQSRINTNKTIEANKRMAEYQYSKDVEMWNAGNLYNNPQSQMERLKAAGLNPNLAYGSGSVAGNTTTQLPKYNAPTADYSSNVPPVNLPAVLNQFQDFQVKQAQIDNLKAERQAITANTMYKEIQGRLAGATFSDRVKQAEYDTKYKNYNAAYMHNRNDIMAETLGSQMEFIRGKNRKLEADINSTLAGTQKMQADTEFTKRKNEWYLTQMFSKLGIDLLGAGMKVFRPFAPKGAGAVNPQVRKPRYNSPTSWKELLGK